MLQQTRVETVIPYYLRWFELFPAIEKLANSSQQQVLAAWEGLGYYARARNIHRTAQIIVNDLDGCFPTNRKELEKLPGIGKASAADLLSICFNQDHAAVDGNIKRILARLYDLTEPSNSTLFNQKVDRLAADLIIPGKAGDINQAWMDLGALICTPKNPDRPACPVVSVCQAKQLGTQMIRPVMSAKPQIPHVQVTAGILSRTDNGQKEYLIAKRQQNKLLGGMWEFPGGKVIDGETHKTCLQRELNEELGIDCSILETVGTYNHAYTHFKVTLHAFHCEIISGVPKNLDADEIAWVKVEDLVGFPMGKIDRMISQDLLKNVQY